MTTHTHRLHRKRQIFGGPIFGRPDNDEPDRNERGGRKDEEEEEETPRRPIRPNRTETETETVETETERVTETPGVPSASPSSTAVVVSPSSRSETSVSLSTATASSESSSIVQPTPSPSLTPKASPTLRVESPSAAVISKSQSTLQPVASGHSTVGAASSTNAGPIVGAVIGAIVGIGVLYFITAFAIRRIRRRRLDKETFDASQFRKSAVMLDDGNNHTAPFMAQQHSSSYPASVTRYQTTAPVSHPGSAYGASTYSPPSIQYGMPQDSGYHYEGQAVVPDHLHHHQQPAGYNYTPLPAKDPSSVAAQPVYVEATRVPTSIPPPLPEKSLPPAPVASQPPTGSGVDPSGPSKPRRQTVYDPNDAYGGME